MATGDKKGCELSLLQLGLRWDKKKGGIARSKSPSDPEGSAAAFNDVTEEDNEENVDKLTGNKQFYSQKHEDNPN